MGSRKNTSSSGKGIVSKGIRAGVPQALIADQLGMGVRTLRALYRAEIDTAWAKRDADKLAYKALLRSFSSRKSKVLKP